MHLILIALFLFLTFSMIIKGCSGSDIENVNPLDKLPQTQNPNDTPSNPSLSNVVSSASIGITGSLYIQDSYLQAALTESGNYDFSAGLSTITHSYASYDYMIGHLETTLGGTEAGEYTGKDRFNSPDAVVTAAKNAGIDMLVTANNHSYDTGSAGLIRTQNTLSQFGIDYTGTRLSPDAPNYFIKEINGIKIGMVSYTFESGDQANGTMTLNKLPVSNEDADLINTFNYSKSEPFYNEAKAAKEAMKTAGADFTIFFIHWGNDYDLKPSATQKKIAQNLCNMGYDFIIGSHPHNVQSMELLTSEDGSTKTYCLYSVGNAISAQRRHNTNLSPKGYTEDGIILGIKFELLKDGTVQIANINATPLWTDEAIIDNRTVYTIIPVDVSYNFFPALGTFADCVNGVIDPNREPFQMETYAPSDQTQISASYTRTMDIVLTGLNNCRQALGLKPISNISGN